MCVCVCVCVCVFTQYSEDKGPVLVIHQPQFHLSPVEDGKNTEALSRCRGTNNLAKYCIVGHSSHANLAHFLHYLHSICTHTAT